MDQSMIFPFAHSDDLSFPFSKSGWCIDFKSLRVSGADEINHEGESIRDVCFGLNGKTKWDSGGQRDYIVIVQTYNEIMDTLLANVYSKE